MPFKTPDGKEFATRPEWRDYMMETFYSFKGKKDEAEPLIKKPGDIDGQVFNIGDCENCTLVVADLTEQVQIDQVKNCRIFIGACASSIFIRNCENCVFYTCCRQLRLREVTNSTFYIMSQAEVHIEYTNTVRFAPFNGGYPQHADHLKAAKLDTKHNLWYDVFDHNDAAKTGSNSSLVPRAEYEAPWFPLGECEPAIALTLPNSVVRTDENAGQVGQSFGAEQMRADAAEIAQSPPKAPAPKATPAPAVAVAVAAPPAAPPSAAPVPEMDPAEEEEADAEGIFMVLKQFAAFEKGDSTEWALPDFSTVLTNNMWCGLDAFVMARGSAEGPKGDVESVESIERKGDVAWCTFASSGQGKTAINTAVCIKTAPMIWKVATVHSSLCGIGNN